MNRTLKLAFGAVVGWAMLTPAFAQENFPDAPEYHWAYQALLNMKNEGILVGYPDGLYRGGRPASRYELAAAVNSAYEKLKGMIGGLSNQIDALKRLIEEETGLDPTQVKSLRDEMTRLKSDMEAMKRWGDDIAALKRMADMFEKELASQGVDVEAMKKDLSDLARRVGELEKTRFAVEIHGDVNLVMHAGHSRDDDFGITVEARPTGFGRGSYAGDPVGMTRDLTIGHEAAFRFSGTNPEGPQWHATAVVGNLLGFVESSLEGVAPEAFYGNQSWIFAGFPYHEQNTRVYLQDAVIMWDTSFLGQTFTAKLGRVPYKAGRYFFQRLDNTSYFENDRWDDHNWYFDGGIFMFDWGAVGLDVWAGRTGDRFDSDSGIFFGIGRNNVWPIMAGTEFGPFEGSFAGGSRPVGVPFAGVFGSGLPIDQALGFTLGVDLGGRQTENSMQSGNDLMFNYMFLDSNTVLAKFGDFTNRVVVWGGELNYRLTDFLTLNGGYSQTDMMYNTDTKNDSENFAWWARAVWHSGDLDVGLGYREIQPLFAAPGDWGRIGIWWNPTDIKGFHADLSYRFSEKFLAKLGLYFYEGTGEFASGLSEDDDIMGINLGLDFPINPTWAISLGWELVNWDLASRTLPAFTGGEPEENWFRVGLKHAVGGDSYLTFMYEISDYDADGVSSWMPSAFWGFGGDRARGGFLTTQWSRKF